MSPIGEKCGKRYRIKYIRYEIMECIIDYAYSLECEITEANLTDLITTAECFCYFSLVDYCAKFILKIVNTTNCLFLLHIARFLFTQTFFFL